MKQLHKVEIAKMRQLADFLETVPPSEFDLGSWVKHLPEPEIAPTPDKWLFGIIRVAEGSPGQRGCGFAGCAMGWAAFSSLFPGLYVDGDEVAYKGFSGITAAAKLFGLTEPVAHFFFFDNMYSKELHYSVDPGNVAERLRRFADIVERRITRYQEKQLGMKSPKLTIIDESGAVDWTKFLSDKNKGAVRLEAEAEAFSQVRKRFNDRSVA